MSQLPLFATQGGTVTPVNVSQVKQLSPFRYPGGKTWFVPYLRRWLLELPERPALFVEPFAGGGVCSLTTAYERLADQIVMVELDGQVSAVWKAILEGDWQNLCDRIMTFDVTPENINAEITLEPLTIEQAAFHTILKNRTYHGGILAAGSGLLKHGEAGKGVLSRWYPDTLRKRIEVIAPMRDRVTIEQSDGIQAILQHAGNPQAVFFVDPPYTSSKKSAGKRLYTHSQLDHEALFDALAAVQGQFIMTYDDAPEVEAMANARGFSMALVPMKGTHNVEMRELVISGNMDWLTSSELHHKLIN